MKNSSDIDNKTPYTFTQSSLSNDNKNISKSEYDPRIFMKSPQSVFESKKKKPEKNIFFACFT